MRDIMLRYVCALLLRCHVWGTAHTERYQFASPNGQGPNIDPLSQSTFAAYMGNFWSKNKDNKLFETMKKENNLYSPRPFSSFSDQELATFSGIFIPGGHAPLTDLGDNPDLGRILWHFHNAAKPTGASSDPPLYAAMY